MVADAATDVITLHPNASQKHVKTAAAVRNRPASPPPRICVAANLLSMLRFAGHQLRRSSFATTSCVDADADMTATCCDAMAFDGVVVDAAAAGELSAPISVMLVAQSNADTDADADSTAVMAVDGLLSHIVGRVGAVVCVSICALGWFAIITTRTGQILNKIKHTHLTFSCQTTFLHIIQ